MGEFDGTVWFRKQITIPQAWVHHDLTLDVGPVDDIDVTFVNGQKVGSHEGEGLWQVNRIYRIPGSLVDSTKLLVAVRVIDYQGGGGIYGKDSLMFVQPEGGSERVSLAGDWKFLPGGSLFCLRHDAALL
jgi:sialate O-acetylesterase